MIIVAKLFVMGMSWVLGLLLLITFIQYVMKHGVKFTWLRFTGFFEVLYRGKWIVLCRRTNPYPVRCRECKAVFRLRDAFHAYVDDGDGGVEAIDECPKCCEQI